MLKPGSKVKELNDCAIRIVQFCLAHNTELSFAWCSRDDKKIKDVDDLSKLWAKAQRLSTQSKFAISSWFPAYKVPNPNSTKVSNTLKSIQGMSRPDILVHPVWTGKSWWPSLATSRTSFIPLGNYNKTFSANNIPFANPSWDFEASCIHPSH
jgi:hypothetical protein